ncbi:MAG: nuclear transport factor 2 family protein [Bdellovibrionaceae bacterium]|nr:nuclear transport factor 2 family protein [Pseudobdellovibrionaceae bacterium]
MKNDENEVLITQLWDLFSAQKWQESKDLFHEEFRADWPPSRERFVGADAFVDMNCVYPGNHQIQVMQLMSSGDRVVSAVSVTADTGQRAFATSFFQIKDRKIWKLIEFWGAPYEAPEWRKPYSQRY